MGYTVHLEIIKDEYTRTLDITSLIVDFTESTVKQTKYDVYLNNGNREEAVLTWKTNFTIMVSGDHSDMNLHDIRTSMTEADTIGLYVKNSESDTVIYYTVSVDLSDIKLEYIGNEMRYSDDTWTFKEKKHEEKTINKDGDIDG